MALSLKMKPYEIPDDPDEKPVLSRSLARGSLYHAPKYSCLVPVILFPSFCFSSHLFALTRMKKLSSRPHPLGKIEPCSPVLEAAVSSSIFPE